ncbi:aspartic peptidase domain-containing protein, partial [Suillus lakei]
IAKMSRFCVICLFGLSTLSLLANASSWVTLPMRVLRSLVEADVVFNGPTVSTYFGTPPQVVNLTVDLAADWLAAYAYDCILCSGGTSFNSLLSSSFQSLNSTWMNSIPGFSGTEVMDWVSFGGILNAPDRPFALIESGANYTLQAKIQNGHLGAFVNPSNDTSSSAHIFSQLYQSGQLLNPVVGFRFDPSNPKITIGALDPTDYDGNLNWVEINTPSASFDSLNTFSIDGLKGYNGSFIPVGNSLTANLDSLANTIAIPNVSTYISSPGFMGPINSVFSDGVLAYPCNVTTPYVALSATINGIDYQIESTGSLLRPYTGFVPGEGYCSVGIVNKSDTLLPPVSLGLPFLRSVYLAYRFPTDGCPGYYGFAFPAGANRTGSQISQTPTSTPTKSSQCLVFTTPTSTPSPSAEVTAQQKLLSSDKYSVYGGTDEAVYLVGVDDLSQMDFLAPVSAAPAPTLTASSSNSTKVPMFVPQPTQSSGTYDVFGIPHHGLVTLVGVDDLPQMVWNTTEVN